MKECKREKIIYFILFVIILVAMIFLHNSDINDTQHEQEEIETLEKRVEELEKEVESYRDNYTALWTTVNSYHNKE